MGNQLKELFDKLVENRMRRAIALTLAIIVTFTTTYALVLPAITLEKDTAETMSGVSMGGNEQNGDTSTSSEEEEPSKGNSDDSNTDTVSFDADAKNEDGETETLVHVEADANAFPEGTTMEATVVTDQDVIDSIMESAEGEVVAVHAVDLTFTDENGETVQPAEGSQVSITLSNGEGETSVAREEKPAADSDKQTNPDSVLETSAQAEDSSGEKTADEQNTAQQTIETTVVQYTEDKGAEAVEASNEVSFQVEPENDLDQDNAVSFDMSEQTGDEESQTYAIVETVPEDDVKEENFTGEAEEVSPGGVGGGAGAEAEEIVPEEQEALPEVPAEEPEESVLTAQSESYLVTVTFGPEAQIPQNAALKVEEILTEDKDYDTHLEETQKVLNEAAQPEAMEEEGVYAGPETEEPAFFSLQSLPADSGETDPSEPEAVAAPEPEIVYARFFDITILDADGGEVTPAAPVKVSIELLDTEQDAQLIQNADAAQVVHFGEETTEVIQAEALEDTVAGVSFDAEGFSVYGLVYTVDFHYKDYVYSIEGGDSIRLSRLFEILEIPVTIDQVESVSFSDPSLVEVTYRQPAFGTVGDWILKSLAPFLTEEYLHIELKDGTGFDILVTDAQIQKTMISASGETYEITVTYGEDAGIPENAELKVREILPGEEAYQTYFDQSLEQFGMSASVDSEGSEDADTSADAETAAADDGDVSAEPETTADTYAHIFDIEIWAGDQKVEPAAEVAVKIRLLDVPEEENTGLKVVHFGKDGPEVMDSRSREEAKEGEAELSFTTESFSVYSVVKVNNNTDLVGDGPWTLVTGIANDPGATTGYQENWGRDYFTIIVNANAMSDKAVLYNNNAVAYEAEGVHAWTDGTNSYVGGEFPQVWNFERVPNSNNYYIYVERDGQKYYIDHHYGNQETTSLSTQYKTEFSIVRNSDGTICIRNANNTSWYLCNSGNGEWSGRDYRFSNDGRYINDARAKFWLCKQSDAFDGCAARKVSVQNLTVNDSFVIYHKFEDSQGNEQLYALASDGSFVRVYDGGDTLYWRETDKNIYWNYRLEGGYYSIYSTNPATNETVYINPMDSTDPKQTLTAEPSRLTLIGKENGDYGTSIENWDQKAYDYAGLNVTINDQGQPVLSTGTRVAGTSDTFLFAVATTMPADVAETVETVDSEALGIHITVFDYHGKTNGQWDAADKEYSAGTKLDTMTNIVGNSEYFPHEANQLVKPYLESGVPSSSTKGAMTGLFTPDGSAVYYSQDQVTNLFLKSYYDENGMFRYRSEDNYAYLGKDGNKKFTVYRQAATPYTTDTQPGHTYYYHGHYMPFNDIDMSQHVGRLMNQYGNEYDPNKPDEIVGQLPIGDGRTYEEVYGTQGVPNFYTGMKLEADFTQLKDGKTESGDPMVFKFTGDDDMWVYIDGVLVLDVGGIHEPLSGTIDFSTGEVNNPTGSSLAGKKTLYDIFMNVKNASGTPQEVKDKINSLTWKDVNNDGTPDTFADYTNHEFKAFYMERGAGASNLDIQFNLKVLHPDEFVVAKELPDGVDQRFVNQEYKFQAFFKDYTDNDKEMPLNKNAKNKDDESVCSGIYYKDRKDEEGNPVEVPVDENGYFTLKPGEAAVFKMADRKIEYTVKEVEVNSNLTQQVEINGQVVNVESGTAEAAYARVVDRSLLNYKNHPYLQNLNIIKHLLPENTQAQPGDVFEFRVYLESTVEVEGETVHQLVPYSYGPYYVIKDGHYYTLTGENNAPEDQGTTPVVCSTTGQSGSINSIPPEYTVVIPNLAVGTHFYIEERRDNIPAGYMFDHEDLIAGTYDEQTLGSNDDIISRILARDEKDHQVFDPDTIGRIKKDVDAQSEVFNKKSTVSVRKQWLKTNGQPYTLEQARQLPGSTNAVIAAELWREKNVQGTGEETGVPVTVTFMVNTTTDSVYRQVSEPVTVKNNSTLEFSLGARGTSQAQEIHAVPDNPISRTSVTSNPKIQYSNGRQKDKWSKYSISGITQDTIIYATFDADKVGDDFVGRYIASMVEPDASSETSVKEKVADITLNNGNDWTQQVSKEPGYTYFLRNVTETGLEGHSHEYTFIDAPTVTTDGDGNLTLAVANKYREPINITVEKSWSPALTSEQENDAYVIVELHRYAKKTKGVLDVVLKDNLGAPIEGAVFKLYKDGAEQPEEYTTDVNGKIAKNNLAPGTYYFKQISTPEGYSMPDPAPQTEDFVVADDSTAPQEKHCELQNQALETNGIATLTLVDNNGAPIQGAKYELRRKSNEEIIKQGLVTDENGKITVSQLKAGTYYFFETEPAEGYNLPNDWQETDFTVVEHPGIVQNFNISMINNLKGNGYVEVTLTGPDQQPISGASFELYKGTEKLAEGTTGDGGKLTFGDSERLAAGTYIIKQISTAPDLLPANQQSITIPDNGQVNQKMELLFSNQYRGKGTATVTLTRKDNNAPIRGATFELYKEGVKVEEKTTDSSGQLIFGDPDKLTVGNYYIVQTSTDSDLQPVVNSWPFSIQENGDPNQTYSWNVQNEDEAGNVTIKLWRKGGFGQWNWDNVNTYSDLKPGRTYTFTARLSSGLYPNFVWYYQDESDHNNYDSIWQNQASSLSPSGWDSSTNSYHFTITPTKDNTLYSYVLISGWGSSNIETMTMDESSRNAANNNSVMMKAQSLAFAAVQRAISSDSESENAQLLSVDSPENESSGVVLTRGAGAPVLTGEAAPANPSGPPSGEYIVDSSFKETYKITKADNNWKHVFENLDKYDSGENPYYYYVVEKECVPDSYHVSSYDNDNLTDTGTITITNELKRGALTIEKAVTVNGQTVPDDAKTIADGDYTFTVTGPNNYSNTVTVTVTNGVTASKELDNLVPGVYTIKETETTNKNGVSLVTTPVELNVAADSQASVNVASFTNNLETTSIKVKKQWLDANGNLDTTATDRTITFTLNQIAYEDENDSNFTEEPYNGAYTNQIVGNGEVEIKNLPVRGTRDDGTPVHYAYTVHENQESIPGYHDTYGTSEDGKEWTIYNTPAASTDQSDPLTVTKQWQDMGGNLNNSLHDNDEITFTVTRHAVATNEYVPVSLSLFDSDTPSTASQVKTYYVKKNSNVTLRFYNSDLRHFLTLSGAGNSANGRYIGEDRPTALYDCEATISVTGPMNLSAQINDRAWVLIGSGSKIHDTWVDNAGHATALPASTKWDYSISAAGTNTLFEDAKVLAGYLKDGTHGGTQLSNQPTYTYTMKGGNQITEGTDFNPQASSWVATLTGLPTYVKVGDHYETYTYTISELKVNGKTVTYDAANSNQGSTDEYKVTLDPATNTITNKEKPVTIEFTKRWLNVVDQAEVWPDGKNITVTVTRTNSGDNSTLTYVYNIGKGNVDAVETEISASSPDGAPKLKVKSIEDNSYQFMLENLPRTDSSGNAYTYTISETNYPDGYQPPKYYDSQGTEIPEGGTTIQSGGRIDNAVAKCELPSTGGHGTRLYTIFGTVLIAGAGLLLWKRREIL